MRHRILEILTVVSLYLVACSPGFPSVEKGDWLRGRRVARSRAARRVPWANLFARASHFPRYTTGRVARSRAARPWSLDALTVKAGDAGSDAGAAPALAESSKSNDSNTEHTRLIRRTCIQSLQTIRDKIKQLIVKNPAALGHLGNGLIDQEALSLHFPVRVLDMKSREVLGRSRPPLIQRKEGIYLQFLALMGNADTRALRNTHYWPFIDVRFEWSWSWPGPFDQETREEFYDILKQYLRPLIDLETSTSVSALHGRGKESFVLRGRPGLGLDLVLEINQRARSGAFFASRDREGADVGRQAGSLFPHDHLDAKLAHDGSYVVMVSVRNTTSGVLAFVPNTVVEVILDRAAKPDRLLDQIGRPQLHRWPGGTDPFIYLQPGETRNLAGVDLGRIGPGEHTIRIVKHHSENGWTDMRPTCHDGRPKYRRVDSAWTGVVVSNELTLVVPDNPATTATDRDEDR